MREMCLKASTKRWTTFVEIDWRKCVFFRQKKKTDMNNGVTCIHSLKHNEIPVGMCENEHSSDIVGCSIIVLGSSKCEFFSLFYQFALLTPPVWHSSLFVHTHSLSRTRTVAKQHFHARYEINERKKSRLNFTHVFFLYLEFYHHHSMFCSILSVCIWCFSLQYSRVIFTHSLVTEAKNISTICVEYLTAKEMWSVVICGAMWLTFFSLFFC